MNYSAAAFSPLASGKDVRALLSRLLPLALLVPMLACASAQAKTSVELVPLEVPPVPPRLITYQPVAEPPAAEPVEEPAPVVPVSSNKGPKTPRPESRAERPDPKPEPPDPTTPAQAAAPIGPLRMNGTAEGPAADRQVKDVLARAGRLLDSVERASLSASRQAEYDGARAFITQAEDNLKALNYVAAKSLADRAENLAKLLGGRDRD